MATSRLGCPVGLRRVHWHVLLALLALALAQPSLALNLLGTALVLAGVALRLGAAGYLDRGGGLCTDGPYRYVRHPLYLGSFVAALGFCLMMNVVWAWVVVLPLFAALYAAQLLTEERHLRARYGEEHVQYAARVPMVTPRLAHQPGPAAPWRLSLLLGNREHYHVLLTLAVAALFYAKWYWRW